MHKTNYIVTNIFLNKLMDIPLKFCCKLAHLNLEITLYFWFIKTRSKILNKVSGELITKVMQYFIYIYKKCID